MGRFLRSSRPVLIGAMAVLWTASCAPAAPASPTAAPPAAKPTEATAAKPLATTAAQPTVPLAPAQAQPTAATTASKLNEYYQKAKASGELKIVHYGPGPEYQPLVDEFRKTYPDVEIELVSLRGTETIQRLAAEAASGKRIANVVSGGQTSQT